MSDLNSEQQRAVDAFSGAHVAVIAGPGSGKTHTLAASVQKTLKTADKILCLTFTNKAAENLRIRIDAPNGIFTGTFHAVAHKLLGAQLENLKILNNDEALAVFAELKGRHSLTGMNARELALRISRAKNGSLDSPEIQLLVKAYDVLLAERGLIDYDDLIVRCLRRLTETPKHYDYIFVDEFQDTSPRQYELLQKLAGKNSKLFVIGDPNQSIYKFRGADGSVFEKFIHDFTPRLINLTINYRSAANVVKVANNIFPSVQAQQANRAEAGFVRVVETLDEYSEADYILSTIEQALAGTDWQHTHHDMQSFKADSFQDFAVLYRTRRQGKVIANKLRAANLPVQILGEESPYATSLARLLRAVLAYIAQPDETTWQKVTLAATNKVKINRSMLNTLDSSQTACELVKGMAKIFNKSDEPVALQFENVAARFQELPAFLTFLDKLSTHEFFDPQADAVILSTIHASKGLEFRHIFLAGCIDGVLPNKRATEQADLAEERRLFYVAVTRTRDTVMLLHSRHCDHQAAQPSRFLKLLDIVSEIDPNLNVIQQKRERSRQKRAQQRLF